MRRFLGSLAAIFMVMMIISSCSAQQGSDVNRYPLEVLKLVNIERARVGLAPLTLARDLTASAYVRAKELPYKFSHTRPNGSKCFTAMPQIGHVLGENLAGGQTTSKTHRENILNKNFKEMGVVYYYKTNSKYKHYWVQHFRG